MKALFLNPVLFLGLALVPVSSALTATRSPAPLVNFSPGVEYGMASWYGARWQGRRMASGERFNEHALTAAHRTLPLGTTVRVTNLRNGRIVTVRIKDRGPYVGRRIIDLSEGAAAQLGFLHRGVTAVKVQVVKLPTAAPHNLLQAQNRPEPRWRGR